MFAARYKLNTMLFA